MDLNNNVEKNYFFYAFALLVVILAGLLILSLCWWYSESFGTLPATEETFAQFGDYMGGIANPVLSFLTILLLLISLHVQIKELRLTREELAESKRALFEANKLTLEQVKQSNRQEYSVYIGNALDKLSKTLWETLETDFNYKSDDSKSDRGLDIVFTEALATPKLMYHLLRYERSHIRLRHVFFTLKGLLIKTKSLKTEVFTYGLHPLVYEEHLAQIVNYFSFVNKHLNLLDLDALFSEVKLAPNKYDFFTINTIEYLKEELPKLLE